MAPRPPDCAEDQCADKSINTDLVCVNKRDTACVYYANIKCVHVLCRASCLAVCMCLKSWCCSPQTTSSGARRQHPASRQNNRPNGAARHGGQWWNVCESVVLAARSALLTACELPSFAHVLFVAAVASWAASANGRCWNMQQLASLLCITECRWVAARLEVKSCAALLYVFDCSSGLLGYLVVQWSRND